MIKAIFILLLLAICANCAFRRDTLSAQIQLATKHLQSVNDDWSDEHARAIMHADPVDDVDLLPALKNLARAAEQTRLLATAIQAAANAMMNSTDVKSIIKTGAEAFYEQIRMIDI